jgi:TolA-binding protein
MPQEIRVLYEIGRTGGLSGSRLDRAEESLRAYLAHQPDWDSPSLASAHYWLGTVLEKKGRWDEVRREYAKALQQEPANLAAKEALRRLS